jgi:hypothetical protein
MRLKFVVELCRSARGENKVDRGVTGLRGLIGTVAIWRKLPFASHLRVQQSLIRAAAAGWRSAVASAHR